MSAATPTICAQCRHKGQGYVKRDSRGYAAHSNAVCLAQPHGIGEIDLVDGSGGEPTDATPCRDVNDGACPDFKPNKSTWTPVYVCAALAVAALVMAAFVAAGVMP